MEKKFYGIKFTFIYEEDMIDYLTAIHREEYDENYMVGYAVKWLAKNGERYGDCVQITFYDEFANEIDRMYLLYKGQEKC